MDGQDASNPLIFQGVRGVSIGNLNSYYGTFNLLFFSDSTSGNRCSIHLGHGCVTQESMSGQMVLRGGSCKLVGHPDGAAPGVQMDAGTPAADLEPLLVARLLDHPDIVQIDADASSSG